ncbi:hypothetical protein [Frankia sp. R82]|uniref:hypothetical protein n=1 Tax=Frankia sp. R82 TaxID=2950553 RepID=UPI0020430E41|nr:hypothetical protein [Frankia sp. R82]MCM3886811.1 hypothetical protein [Frankia sp. R82]
MDWLSQAIEAVAGDVLSVYDAYVNNFKHGSAGTDADVAVWRVRVACVAMLEGATYPIISFAEKELIRISDPSDPPEKSAHPFSLQDMTDWLNTVEAAPDPNGIPWSRPVRFKQLSLGAALRRYFWEFNPHLVDIYLEWFDQLAAGLSRYRDGSDALARLAERIIDQTVDSGEGADLLLLAQRWMERPERPHRVAATMALRRGLDDERASVLFRQAFYDWSRDSRLPPHAASLLIGLCKELAVDHPDAAITRLWHFMAHPERRVGSAAADSMMPLGRSAENYTKVLNKIMTYLAERAAAVALTAFSDLPKDDNRYERRTSRAVEIFLELTETDRLQKVYPDAFNDPARETTSAPILSPELRSGRPIVETLTLAWRVALAVGRPWALVPRLKDWLTAADRPGRIHILDILVDACGNRLKLRNMLTNQAWAATMAWGGDPALERIYEELLDRLISAAEATGPDGNEIVNSDQTEKTAEK